uniref:AAA+ ATPase domain-containing protein n=1 Tax=Pinguiococcus pyrenoidosus TaxID=172671 RepID=A0A7R9YFH1_9STRA|eukprot:scaffold5136_cov229-Pinguiococcus_pyrenoidosus.AAC.2
MLGSGAKKSTRSTPWIEKHRPACIRDVASQDEVVQTLTTAVRVGAIPHLLFYGPPGTGKTSTILAMARDLFGTEWRKRVLELNASDERGIKVIRDKVKGFAAQAVPADGRPQFKIVILDEADTMTVEAQSALRRTMETYSRVTRFCLVCNYVTRIIEPLASRCAKFRFKPLPPDSMIERLREIAEKEGMQVNDELLGSVVNAAGGDMRCAVTTLQSSAALGGVAALEQEEILELSGVVPDAVLEPFWKALEAQSFESLQQAVRDILAEGWPMDGLLKTMLKTLLENTVMQDEAKARFIEKLAEAESRFIDGAGEELQLLDVGASMLQQSF